MPNVPEERDYFGWLPAEITRAVPESVINTIASMVCHAHRRGRKEASNFLKQFVFRFDMSEFLHLDKVKLFMGDETGRIGRLGQVLSTHHEGVLLFDEIEKAHRLIWDLFLQMLDSARITLPDHHTYNLSKFYIVCTSNIGSQQLLRPTRLPFTTLERAVLSELYWFFRPELIGRFDEKIVFKPLSPEVQREIGRTALAEETARLRTRGFDLTISDEAFEFLVRRGI
jgi:ATP-dependent Clp protease ATP-binding subunit ClpA